MTVSFSVSTRTSETFSPIDGRVAIATWCLTDRFRMTSIKSSPSNAWL